MPACFMVAKAGASCSDLLIRDSVSARRNERVATSSGAVSSVLGEFAFASTPTRVSDGSASRNNSSYLASRSGASVESPVMLPPGRARLTTNPLRTGSGSAAMTIGIVAVASRAARMVRPRATMTCTGMRTSSAASPGKWSRCPSA